MSERALDILRREHRAISAVLFCLKHTVDEARKGAIVPPFAMIHAVLDYLTSFPNRFHHPKEDSYLFPAVLERAPDLEPVIAELLAQHEEGEERVNDLKDRVAELQSLWNGRWQGDGAAKFGVFADAVDRYVAFERAHARKEGVEVMPRAQELLTAEDWAPIEAAFSANDDPIFGSEPRSRFDNLYSEIVALAPAPMGYAEREKPATAPAPEADSPFERGARQKLLTLNWI
ncbi:MAG: hemerythrin domain-containing protein [Rhodospirillaceae bacterium]|nr:hemerythrin domain-containing protein [Rhodospirillaceae bacterium]